MAISDYEIKNDQPTTEVTGMIDSISRRLSLTVNDPTEITETATLASKVSVRLSNAKSGKIEEIPDLKLQMLLNNAPFGGEQDFSTGKWNGDVDGLEIGRDRFTAQIVGYGLAATVIVTVTKKAVAPASTLPAETDSFVTGLSTLWTQTTFKDQPTERAGVEVIYTRDDLRKTYKVKTDARGIAHCDKITITRPTWFTIVAPTAGIKQTPERLCIVPPPVGVPKWPKIIFYLSALALCVSLGFIILTLFISSGGAPDVVKLASEDPIERMWATAQNNYKGYDKPGPEPSKLVAIRSVLLTPTPFVFLVVVGSGIACIFNACIAVGRNWKYRYMEDRTGTIPKTTALQTPQVGQGQPAQSSLFANKFYQQGWEIAKELIAEMSADAAMRKIRAFKLPRIVAS
ncbi:MAG: hypothetical protein G01um101448_952 [Parcubacteria group bacterium Gr01-1014_48]|nr:MAG: hypothetical protein Greene041614_1037 [Parcubacteria group bacterium Greene0416_14]TSC72553.1 MAG: hypothetical protein G01um101448_952 [Parcubacteria group bacterium Gr01-1014_48]TSD01334.1 MAG: hypothetical protein Greene101415_348 [Parcubacteria group bacterium Greene1014_15]TSD08022.1 MAG: hypothetical protein Greene07144_510 [Parcubacteria group bacterium Greene0714_4]